MTSLDPLDEQRAVRLRQRLWGAAVLIAVAVIFLPLLLDGSGSESQYRRVERLREEPPRVVGPSENTVINERNLFTETENISRPESVETSAAIVGDSEPASSGKLTAPTRAAESSKTETRISAWVVQAGSFSEEQNAIAVRDRLRSAGYPSFVTTSKQNANLFRVRVGPMISYERALENRDKVSNLIGMESMVISYP